MTLILVLIQCLLFVVYITGVFYWYTELKGYVYRDNIYSDSDDCQSSKYMLMLIVALLWPVVACYVAIKKLKIKVDK